MISYLLVYQLLVFVASNNHHGYKFGIVINSKSNINAITKNEKLHSSINSILIAGGKQTTSTKKIVPNYKSEEEFLKANQNLFNDILDSISIIKKSLNKNFLWRWS